MAMVVTVLSENVSLPGHGESTPDDMEWVDGRRSTERKNGMTVRARSEINLDFRFIPLEKLQRNSTSGQGEVYIEGSLSY
jgi:hypothetical protein